MAAPPPPPKGPAPPPAPKGPIGNTTIKAAPSKQGASLSDILAKKRVDPTTASEPSPWAKGFNYFQEKSKSGFVGLSNQGATCYLNSLIQTLYMTPEFQVSLFNWHYSPENDGPEQACIPLQLQKLFGRLKLGEPAVCETKDLTVSFGWTAGDAFRQHDVQELMRKLFEAMEIIFKKGNLLDKKAAPIMHLYEGILKDYIKCQMAEGPAHERVRHDLFMDLLLSVRDIDSLEAALSKYTEDEILEGDNAWCCDGCEAKVRAAKGLKIKTAPLFLTLQLKRFDYDYSTWQRIKLNNKVSFPLDLDISPWLTEESESRDNSNYELFSVLIHSGGAAGGHYYAIIKDVYNGRWFKFNDASVSEVDAKEVEAIYGEQPTSEKSKNIKNQNFSTNAYLLFYRRKGDLINVKVEYPEYIKKFVDEENEKFRKEKEDWIKQRDNLPLDIHYKDQVYKLHIDKSELLSTATESAWKLAHLDETKYTLDNIRIRKYNPQTGTLGRAFAKDEFSKKLDELGFIKNTILMIETREPGEEWVQDLGEYKLQLVRLNEETKQFEDPITIIIPSRDTTVKEVKDIASKHTSCTSEKLRIIKVNAEGACRTISQDEDDKELQKDFGLVDGNTIYVENSENNPSAIESLFEEARNRIQVYFNLLNESVFDQEISISKSKTLKDLRNSIAKHLSIEPNQFKISKGKFGVEFKENDKTLEAIGIFDGQAVFIQQGVPQHANEIKLKFVLYDQDNDQFIEDEVPPYEGITENTLIETIRDMAMQHPQVKEKVQDPTYIRLRAKQGKKAGNILHNGKTLKESLERMVDNPVIALQILTKPEFVKSSEILVLVKQWHPSKQEMDEKAREVVLPYGSTISLLKNHLASEGPIESENIVLARPFSYQLKNKNTLSTLLNWQIQPETPLEEGDLILVKDKRDKEVEIEGLPVNQTDSGQPKPRPKEEGIKIHTLYDEEGRKQFRKLGISDDGGEIEETQNEKQEQ